MYIYLYIYIYIYIYVYGIEYIKICNNKRKFIKSVKLPCDG